MGGRDDGASYGLDDVACLKGIRRLGAMGAKAANEGVAGLKDQRGSSLEPIK